MWGGSLRLCVALVAASVLLSAPAAHAQSGADDLTFDLLILESNTAGFTDLRSGTTGWVAMRGTKLRVNGQEKQPKTDKDKKQTEVTVLTVTVLSVPCVVEESNQVKSARRDRIHVGVGGLADCAKEDANKLVKVGEVYTVEREQLNRIGFLRSGWVYGALLVPYKYHRDDKSFSSGVTIGPYVGYRMGGLGFNTSAIASVGIASLSVPDGKGGTSTLQGYTAALGIIGSLTKGNPVQLGILIGKDWAGSNSATPYQHEGKTWFAVQIGFDFSK